MTTRVDEAASVASLGSRQADSGRESTCGHDSPSSRSCSATSQQLPQSAPVKSARRKRARTPGPTACPTGAGGKRRRSCELDSDEEFILPRSAGSGGGGAKRARPKPQGGSTGRSVAASSRVATRKAQPGGSGGGGIFKTAAVQVLRQEMRLLTTGDITRLALQRELIHCRGKTPDATMASALYTDVKRKESTSVFIRPQEGLFGLREWAEAGLTCNGLSRLPASSAAAKPAVALAGVLEAATCSHDSGATAWQLLPQGGAVASEPAAAADACNLLLLISAAEQLQREDSEPAASGCEPSTSAGSVGGSPLRIPVGHIVDDRIGSAAETRPRAACESTAPPQAGEAGVADSGSDGNSRAEPPSMAAAASAADAGGLPAMTQDAASAAPDATGPARQEQAREVQRRLATLERYLGADHPQVGKVWLLLARLHQAGGDPAAAEAALASAYGIFSRCHPGLAALPPPDGLVMAAAAAAAAPAVSQAPTQLGPKPEPLSGSAGPPQAGRADRPTSAQPDVGTVAVDRQPVSVTAGTTEAVAAAAAARQHLRDGANAHGPSLGRLDWSLPQGFERPACLVPAIGS